MFFTTEHGLTINLKYLVRAHGSGRLDAPVDGEMSDGSIVRLYGREVYKICDLTRNVVPARPGDRAVVFTWYGPGDGDEKSHDVAIFPIVAWTIEGEVASPVFPDELLHSQQRYAILFPDGSVCSPYDRRWKTTGEFVDEMVKEFGFQEKAPPNIA